MAGATMRRAVLLALPVAAALAVGGILWLRRGTDDARNDMATVAGTVTGRYGTVWNVRITAEAGGRILAETWTSVNGYYAIDVPAAIRIELCALPIPETYLVPERRPLALRPGERRVEPFELRTAVVPAPKTGKRPGRTAAVPAGRGPAGSRKRRMSKSRDIAGALSRPSPAPPPVPLRGP
jgi:hypothetical protein